jgi:hypothetical protein
MNATTQKNSPATEDIDLLLLAERSVSFFRKYKWFFIAGLTIGLLAGFLLWRSKPKVYQSRMIIHSFTLSNEDYIQVVDNFNRLLQKGEHDQLAALFNIPRESLSKARQMKGYQIQKVFTANNPNGFYIDVYVTDNRVLPELQKGILRGFENVEYIRKQISIRKANLELLIAEVEKEIRQLDSTKTKVGKLLEGKPGYSSSLMIDVSGLNRQLVDLNEKLLTYKQELQFATAVQVLQGFNAFSKPAGPKLAVWLGLGVLSGLAVAYIISLYLSISDKLKTRRLRYSNGT